MKSGTCPKCNASAVYQGSSSPLHAGDGLLHLEAYPPKRAVNLLLDAYVCAACGYSEMYVAEQSQAKLSTITEDPTHWRKVS